MNDREIKRKIMDLLREIGMKNTQVGFFYWINAIAYYIDQIKDDPYKIVSISNVYDYLSKKHDVSKDCLEKIMRYAKEKSNYIEKLKINKKMKNYEFLIEISLRIAI